MKLGVPIPILRIFDEAKAKGFYVDFLGFVVDWEHRFEPGFPLYLQVSRMGCTLHLSEHHGDATPGSALRVDVEGLEQFRDELLRKNYGPSRPSIGQKPWGRDMPIVDPFGNRITFSEPSRT